MFLKSELFKKKMPWVCSWNARHFKHKCRAFSWQTHGISGVNSRYFGSKPAAFRKRTLQDSKIAFFTLQTDQYLYWLVLLYLYIYYRKIPELSMKYSFLSFRKILYNQRKLSAWRTSLINKFEDLRSWSTCLGILALLLTTWSTRSWF